MRVFALVAQLDRVLPSEGRGQWFKSTRAHQQNSLRGVFLFLLALQPQHFPCFIRTRNLQAFLFNDFPDS